jgi:hypothetical protein
MRPRTFPQSNLDKMAIRAVLWPLSLCVLYYCNLFILCLPPKRKYEEKGGFRSRVFSVLASNTMLQISQPKKLIIVARYLTSRDSDFALFPCIIDSSSHTNTVDENFCLRHLFLTWSLML